jgi:hypothetical protein
MATFTYTFGTINQVLKNNGKMRFSELANVLMNLDPRRFRDERTVETAITDYTACLKFDGGIVEFNKNAKRYAKFDIMERDVQAALHNSIDNMGQWALYPFKTRKNSDKCYLGILWNEIPRDEDEKRYNMNYPQGCDFRGEGENSCRAGCGVDEIVLKKYKLI